tara:strand:+ start:32 stop:1372 length:1341 start_codon:yes stop_codon:yes gene_type:complete
MANTYLSKTFSSAGNQTTWTFSVWVKRCILGGEQPIFSRYQSSDYQTFFGFAATGQLVFKQVNAGSTTGNLTTNRLFRDTAAWYHLVAVWDTTNGTAGDRMKLYVNGVEETSFATDTNPSSSLASTWNTAHPMEVGRSQSNYFNGYMSNIAFVDGTALTPTSFGETDTATGIWKFKSISGVTWGTNGFHLKGESSGNLGTDSSSNTSNWTLNGDGKQAIDTPSNNYCTLNPLWFAHYEFTFSNGNGTSTTGGAHRPLMPTIALSKGKWYIEGQALAGSATKWWWGLAEQNELDYYQWVGSGVNIDLGSKGTWNNQAVYNNNLNVNNSTAISSMFASGAVAAGDYVGIAVDLDNQKVWYSKGGIWNNGSGTESTTLNASYPDSTSLTAGDHYYIAFGGESCGWHMNYGNGYFGLVAAGTNQDGNSEGKFKYPVPSGFLALNTNNMES